MTASMVMMVMRFLLLQLLLPGAQPDVAMACRRTSALYAPSSISISSSCVPISATKLPVSSSVPMVSRSLAV